MFYMKGTAYIALGIICVLKFLNTETLKLARNNNVIITLKLELAKTFNGSL